MNTAAKILISLIFLSGCTEKFVEPLHVQFQLPDNYLGFFEVRRAEDGFAIPEGVQMIAIRVPESGLVNLIDQSPLREWHKTSMVYHSQNVPIPVGVILHTLWTDTEGTTMYLVGTDKEAEDSQRMSPWDVKPRGRPSP